MSGPVHETDFGSLVAYPVQCDQDSVAGRERAASP